MSMRKNYFIDPPEGLFKRITECIHKKQCVLDARHRIIFSVLLVASAVSFLPALKLLQADLSESGFLSFFSLLFSDFFALASAWQSFALILLETIPALSLALFLAVIVVFLQSLKLLTQNMRYEFR